MDYTKKNKLPRKRILSKRIRRTFTIRIFAIISNSEIKKSDDLFDSEEIFPNGIQPQHANVINDADPAFIFAATFVSIYIWNSNGQSRCIRSKLYPQQNYEQNKMTIKSQR